ncbi:MAG: zinc ribbon domain-containing protein [Clostridium sp.]|nr:zinc ribbon domain-containing protein [Clostridium sp.]
MLGKIKESIDKGLVSVSVKSGTYLETEKLKAKVNHVQDEIRSLKLEMGEKLYEQWKSGNVEAAYIDMTCRTLKDKEEEILQYQKQIDEITLEKEKILGGENRAEAAPALQGGLQCSCGKVNVPGARFCKGCGKKLEEAPAPQAQTPAACPKCGAALEEGARFCCECGTSI